MSTRNPKGEPELSLDAEERSAESLLAELAEIERLDQTDESMDPRWEALCEGRLSEEEVRALERETPADERSSLEAFRPLSKDFQDDTVRRLEQMRAGDAERPAAIHPLRRPATGSGRWPRQLGLLAAVLVTVVGAAILGFGQLEKGPATALPSYSVEWSGGAFEERDAEPAGESAAEVPRWRPGTELQLLLRPVTAVEGQIYAHAYLERGGETLPWPGPGPEIAPSGAVRLSATLPVDGAPVPGRWLVLVFLSKEPGAPAPEDVRRRPARQQQDSSHRRVAQAVDILEKAF
ncbi:MAG: hypothetical protein AAF725_10890 [Acidobacteriota bacterium]